ncbi:MAG: DNA-directed RNA polymerase subunit B, partial [Candidatus Aenigmarchaeota archaeon]|nr:DNA-directed RNA polymerase subunit B [Candidatus Aenigmarchaeota archaeon]
MGRIYIDGKFAGTHDNLVALKDELIQKRRKGVISNNANISYVEERDEIHINIGGGRARRPLIVVEGGKSKLTQEYLDKIDKKELKWQDLIDKNIIEYLDAEEEENTFVALKEDTITKDHTHVEIDPLLILGLTASLLPYPEKNRGDRLNYGARMVVQATGLPYQNYHLRDDTTGQLLDYPQVPMAQTKTVVAAGLQSHPSGQNLVVAVMPFYGYNIEDAMIINKASLDRGFGRSYFFRTYITESRRYWGGQEDELGVPDSSVRGYKSEEEYKDLGSEGIINPETVVDGGSVLVAKTSPLRFLGVQKEVRMGMNNRRENSLTVKKGEDGTVEKVILTEDGEGNKLIKVCVREYKVPEVGDKIASRHGQKGVIG